MCSCRAGWSCALTWDYTAGRDDPNDAVHAAYLVDGLLQVDKHVGLPELDTGAAIAWLSRFVDESGSVTRFIGRPEPDRSWGLGQLPYVFCTYADDASIVAELRDALNAYEYAPGHYGPHPGVEIMYRRFQAHVLLGFSACEQDPRRVTPRSSGIARDWMPTTRGRRPRPT